MLLTCSKKNIHAMEIEIETAQQQEEMRLQMIIDTVMGELKEGRCVLFLGPELLINSSDERYYKAYFKELAKKYPKVIFKYFSRDNVFSFLKSGDQMDIVYGTWIRNEIKKFYETTGDEIILNLIAQLPFSLIVNVAPDNAINKIFQRNNFTFRSAYFPEAKYYNIDKPSINNPIIYNIFGSVEEKQSIILTHEELFKRIKNLMQKNAVPPEIEKTIEEAKSFIFLGMKFETWYYQLLLSIFDIEISSSTKLSAPKDADEETVSIMNKYFQIDFTKSNSLDFIGKIYDKIKEEAPNCLRQPKIQTSTSSYISYAWKDDIDNNREKWVNETETTLTDKGVKVFRDKNELTIQDSIQAFMNRIGRGRAAVIVVSDKYLKSEYCMYEAWSIFKNDNFLDRAFIMILPDAHIDRDEDKTKYITFWQSKTNEIRKRIEEDLNSDFLAVDEFMSNYKGEMYILLFINQFLKILSDQIWFRVIEEKTDEDAKTNKANFEMFIQKILTKLNEG